MLKDDLFRYGNEIVICKWNKLIFIVSFYLFYVFFMRFDIMSIGY